MNILAFDTATTGCSAALLTGETVTAHRSASMPRGQSEALMPMIAEVLAEAGADYGDLDLLAVTVGPGAFTGLRIGLAAARAMMLAAGIPCLGITTLEAVAHGSGLSADTLLVALDSKRADLYVQAFDRRLKPHHEPRALLPGDLPGLMPVTGPLTVIGDAAERGAVALGGAGREVVIGEASGVPDAGVVAGLAAARWRPGEIVASPDPLYLRPPDAIKPKNGGRLRP